PADDRPHGDRARVRALGHPLRLRADHRGDLRAGLQGRPGPGEELTMGTNGKGNGLWTALAVPIMLWTALPLLWMLSLSLKTAEDLANPDASVLGNFWPKTPTMENYEL